MKNINQNEKNGQWKGDKVTYNALHAWVRRKLPKPDFCPICQRKKKLELMCKNHQYSRDLEKFIYVCRSCHSAIDQKVLSITKNRKIKKCPTCGKEIYSWRRYCIDCAHQIRLKWWKQYNFKRRHFSSN